jgi:uncharacterized protein (TIGR03083 family)
VTTPDHRRLLERESQLLASVTAGDLALDVAHLPGWTLQTLVGHAGWVLRYAAASLTAPPEDAPRRSSVPEPPVGEEVLAWFADARAELLDRLDAVDPDSLHATFTGPQPARWWLRRLAHELALHRWDAQAAVGAADPIDPELARDGIDELFEVFVPRRLDLERLSASGETVHLHATDLEGEWMCVLRADGVDWSHGHGKGDVAARGPVADLLLLLWGRIPPTRLELFGDAGILDRWQEAAHF